MLVDFDVIEQQDMDFFFFFTGGSIIMDYVKSDG